MTKQKFGKLTIEVPCKLCPKCKNDYTDTPFNSCQLPLCEKQKLDRKMMEKSFICKVHDMGTYNLLFFEWDKSPDCGCCYPEFSTDWMLVDGKLIHIFPNNYWHTDTPYGIDKSLHHCINVKFISFIHPYNPN